MYRDTTEQLAKSQGANAEAAAGRIEQFISEIERQISWATRASSTTVEQRRTDYALLLQQVPAIDRLIYLDGAGREQFRLVRDQPLIAGSELDYSGDPSFKERADKPVWLSPIYFDGRDPFMAIAMAHSGRNAGSTVAEVNLKFLSTFIDRSRIGEDVEAYRRRPEGPAARAFQSRGALGNRSCGPSAGAPA